MKFDASNWVFTNQRWRHGNCVHILYTAYSIDHLAMYFNHLDIQMAKLSSYFEKKNNSVLVYFLFTSSVNHLTTVWELWNHHSYIDILLHIWHLFGSPLFIDYWFSLCVSFVFVLPQTAWSNNACFPEFSDSPLISVPLSPPFSFPSLKFPSLFRREVCCHSRLSCAEKVA